MDLYRKVAEKLAGWLKIEAGKSRKQRRTVKQLHADLVALGFTGSYAQVAAFARSWRADRQLVTTQVGADGVAAVLEALLP